MRRRGKSRRGSRRFIRRLLVKGRTSQGNSIPVSYLTEYFFGLNRRLFHVLRSVRFVEGVLPVSSNYGALRVFYKDCFCRLPRKGGIRLSHLTIQLYLGRNFLWGLIGHLFISYGTSERVLLVEIWRDCAIFLRDDSRRAVRLIVESLVRR